MPHASGPGRNFSLNEEWDLIIHHYRCEPLIHLLHTNITRFCSFANHEQVNSTTGLVPEENIDVHIYNHEQTPDISHSQHSSGQSVNNGAGPVSILANTPLPSSIVLAPASYEVSLGTASTATSAPPPGIACPIPECPDGQLRFVVHSRDTCKCTLGVHLNERHGVIWRQRSGRHSTPEFACFWPRCQCKKPRPACSAYGGVAEPHSAHVNFDAWKHILDHVHGEWTCECSKKFSSNQVSINHRTRGWQKYWKNHVGKAKVKKCHCSMSFTCVDAMLGHQQQCPSSASASNTLCAAA
jgi:hypothetical protein